MTTTTSIRRRSTGRRTSVTGFDIPVPTPEAEKMLPKAVRDARNKAHELAVIDNIAQGAIFTTSEAITAAETRDAEELGAAILVGEPDPGPVHATAARQAHAEARRYAEGTAKAHAAAMHAYFAAMGAADFTDTIDQIEAAAAAEVVKVDEALSTLRQAFVAYRGLRTLADRLALHPEIPVGFEVDAQDFGRSLDSVRGQLAAMGPGHDEPEVRGNVTAAEGSFTSRGFTPRMPAA